MHHKYESQGLVTVSLALDEYKDHDTALKFLQKVQANLRNLIVPEGDNVDTWADKFTNDGALPARWVYGRDGKGKRFDGANKTEEIENAVKQQLQKN